jgi:virginiamycin B lyase
MSMTNLSLAGKPQLAALWSIVVSSTLMAQAPAPAFARYRLPSPGAGIATGPDGALWYTGYTTQRIGRITTAGAIAEYRTSSHPYSIVAGPDGAMWFTEDQPGWIGRITPSGVITEYRLPCCGVPTGIAAGSDGALWFSQAARNTIGRITTEGSVTEYPLPNPDARSSHAIAAGPDGALWFAEDIPAAPDPTGYNATNKIGRITTSGEVTEYSLPSSSVYQGVFSLAAGPDGAMWFTEYYGGNIARISMDGVVTEYGNFGSPAAIAAGPDGALWFTESSDNDWVNAIGRITTSGESTEYRTPVQNINFGAITTGPDGAVWFTDAWSLDPSIVRVDVGSGLTTPVIAVMGNAGSYSTGGVSPGENIVIFGTGIGPPALVTGSVSADVWSTTTGNTRVLFDGVPAAVIYASATQTSVMVPYSVTGRRTTSIVVEHVGAQSNAVTVDVIAAAPGIYTLNQQGTGPGAILNQDGAVNAIDAPAPRGTVIAVYMTGEGQTSPAGVDGAIIPAVVSALKTPLLKVSATVGGVDAAVLYAGSAPGLISGIMQVNLAIPDDAPTGPSVPIVIRVGVATTQEGVTVAVQ